MTAAVGRGSGPPPLRALVRQIGWEQRSYWRNPAAAAFTFAFPLLFLVIVTALNGNDRVSLDGGEVRSAADSKQPAQRQAWHRRAKRRCCAWTKSLLRSY